MTLDLEDSFTVGEDSYFSSTSPTTSYGVTFEDDLTTGYFYAVDTHTDLKVLDALHIYNVTDVTDKNNPRNIKITWTDDGTIASLLINNYCHAIFDFENKAGYCRNSFPETNREWVMIKERTLTDKLIEDLFKFKK